MLSQFLIPTIFGITMKCYVLFYTELSGWLGNEKQWVIDKLKFYLHKNTINNLIN